MLRVRRSTGASRDRWITAGVILVVASLHLPVLVESNNLTTSFSPDTTTLLNVSTSLQPSSDATTKQPDVTSPPPTTVPSADVTTRVTSSPTADVTTNVTSFPTTVPLAAVTSANGTGESDVSMDVSVSGEPRTEAGVTTDNTTWGMPGDGDDVFDDSALAIEFVVVIVATVLVLAAVMIVIVAVLLCCCRKRAETPTRFVKFKKRKPKHKYDKMDVEMSTLPRKHEPTGGSWIFTANETGEGDPEESASMDLNLKTHIANDNYDPDMNGTVETAPSISDYHSESTHGHQDVVATLELEDDDNELNVNPMYSNGNSNKDSGIHGNGSDVIGDGEMSVRSDTDLQTFADDSVDL